MARLEWAKVSKFSQLRSQGSETNTILPGGEDEGRGLGDPNYKPKPSSFQKIAKRVEKLLMKDPGPKFEDRIKPFSVEQKKKKQFRKTD